VALVPWWRKLLALLGLTEDARVRVRAPGIEVIITGDPDLAKKVLAVVKQEIAHQSSRRRGDSVMASPAQQAQAQQPQMPRQMAAPQPQASGGRNKKKAGHSQVVRPSELDEMDSPYAIPEHAPMNNDNENNETPADGLAAEMTMNVDGMIEHSRDDNDEPPSEATAVDVASPASSALPTLIPQVVGRAPSRMAAGPKVMQSRRIQDPTDTE